MSGVMDISGVIPVLKAAGMTSHDVVARLRRKLGIKKIGHTGTLDPMVTGVLPVLIGKATRLSDFFMNMPKRYRAVGLLGKATDTEDIHGSVISETALDDARLNIDAAAVESALHTFVGEIEQIPPDYSAVKIKGKKLIDLVHRGEVMPEKQARRVRVYEITFEGYRDFEFTFDILCSKGTYVRTICSDVGKKLGIPACMKDLMRTASGGFFLSEAIPLEECDETSVIPMREAVRRIGNVPRFVLPFHPRLVRCLENGIRIDVRGVAKRYEMTDSSGQLRVITDPVALRALADTSAPFHFLYVEDRFYGIVGANFELEKLIKDC